MRALRQPGGQPELADRMNSIGRQVHTRAAVVGWGTLDDEGLDVALSQRPGSREARDPAAHHQYRRGAHCHLVLHQLAQRRGASGGRSICASRSPYTIWPCGPLSRS